VADPLPLAAAAQRLRGTPGRPRKQGTTEAHGPAQSRVNSGRRDSAHDSESGRRYAALPPRLLDVAATGAYLGGLADDTVRELDASGVLTPARVLIPSRAGQPLRKVLFDRETLDRLVVGWRTPS